MTAPVRAKPGQIVEASPPAPTHEDQGSYPDEISPEHLGWLQERAAERRRKWAEHAKSLACNQKS